MRPADMLSDLAKARVQIWPDGKRLRYRAPDGVMTPARVAYLRKHRTELLALLQAATPNRQWMITRAGNEPMRVSYCPPATRAEVETDYTGATIEAYEAPRTAPPPMTAPERTAILAWLTRIGELDEGLIAETLERCEGDADDRRYFLERATVLERDPYYLPGIGHVPARPYIPAPGDQDHETREGKESDRVNTLAKDFYDHVFGAARLTGCCWAPIGRYCDEGIRLRAAYYRATRGSGR